MNRSLVSLGDIAIEVVSQKPLGWSGPFSDFLNVDSKAKEIDLSVTLGPCRAFSSLKAIFDSGTTWSLSQEDSRFVMQVPSFSSPLSWEARVFFDPRFQKGEMFLNPERYERFLDCPLTYPFGEIWMMHLLPPRHGILIHSFGLLFGENAYLFVGSSGQGKTTSARLWQEAGYGQILSDDRVIVRKEKGGWFAYGTPWHGEAHLSSPLKAPLKKLFFLKHAQSNEIRPLSFMDALQRLMVRSFHPYWNSPLLGQSTDVAVQLVREIPACEFGFLPDPGAVDFIQKHL
ncbi:MAG: hypothetical protein HY466_02645 [Deltaproteobacteria bacterium]|nr:hypothetical protein [Deltaproteobacteria bacterium]